MLINEVIECDYNLKAKILLTENMKLIFFSRCRNSIMQFQLELFGVFCTVEIKVQDRLELYYLQLKY